MKRKSELLREKAVRKARSNINDFIEYCFTDRKGHRLIQGELHRRWQKHVDDHELALIEGPHEHGKTEQMPIARTLWWLGKDCNELIKIVGQDDSQAMKRLAAVRSHMEHNERLHQVFPHLKKHPTIDKWTDHELIIDRDAIGEKEPSVEARGVLSSATGSRATKLIFDDICDRRNTINLPALRPKVTATLHDVWMNLLEDDGQGIYIFTAWHKQDCSAELKTNSEWALYQELIDDEYTPIWIEKWPVEALKKRERRIGTRNFARGFKGKVLSDEDKTFPPHVIARAKNTILPASFIDPHWPCVIGVDLAISKKKQAANTVLFPVRVDPKGVRYPLLDHVIRKKMSSTRTAFHIVEMWKYLHPLIFFVENNTYQKALLEFIRLIEGPAIPIKGYLTGAQKNDESIGIPALATGMEMGAWNFLFEYEHELSCRCLKCKIMQEFEDYPLGVYKDSVMAAWFADRAAVAMGLNTRGVDLSKYREDYPMQSRSAEYDDTDYDDTDYDDDSSSYGNDPYGEEM